MESAILRACPTPLGSRTGGPRIRDRSGRPFPPLLAALGLVLALASPALAPDPASAQNGITRGIPPAARVQVPDSIRGTPAHVRLVLFNRQFGEADTLAQALLAAAEERHGPSSLETAEALDLLASVRTHGPSRRSRLAPDERAWALAERAMAIKDSLLAPADPRRAPTLACLSLAACEVGDTARGWALAESSLALRERAYGSEHPEVALGLRLLARLKQAAGDPGAAEALGLRALGIQERTVGPLDLEVQPTCSLIWTARLLLQRPYRESTYLARREVEILERHLGPNAFATLINRSGLAQHLSTIAPGEAESLFVETIRRGEEILGPRHVLVARNYADFCGFYAGNPDPVKGRRVAEEATRRFPESGFLQGQAGLFFEQIGDYEGALGAYQRGVVASVAPSGYLHAALLCARGKTLMRLGRYQEARDDFTRARTVFDSAAAVPAPAPMYSFELAVFAPQADLGMARLLVELGEYREARALFERGVAASVRAWGSPGAWASDATATDRNAFGEALLRMGDPGAALAQFEAAERSFSEEYRGVDPVALAATLGQAKAHLALGDRPAARALLARTTQAQERGGASEHPLFALTLKALAGIDRDGGRHDRAQQLLERAAAIEEATYGPVHPELAATLNALAEAALARDDAAAALGYAARAERSSREHTRLVARELSERQALGLAGVRTGGLDGALGAAEALASADAARDAWDVLIRSRAMVLDEMARRRQALDLRTDAVTDSLWTELERARARLANLSVREASWTGSGQDPASAPMAQRAPDLRGLFRDARDEKERLEEALARRSAAFRREREREAIGYAEVLRALPEGSALVAYVRHEGRAGAARAAAGAPDAVAGAAGAANGTAAGTAAPAGPSPGEERYAAFVLRAGEDAPRLVPLGPAGPIERAAGEWRARAADVSVAEEAVRRAGQALRERVWDPVASSLAGARQVFVVPDGGLNLVSFAALPGPEDGYLVESGPVLHVLSAERDLVPGDDAPVGSGLLALGDPRFDREISGQAAAAYRGPRSGCRAFGALRFEPLPATAMEVLEVSRAWGGADRKVLVGTEATEAAFKRLAPGRRVLHLATHGFFLGGACRPEPGRARGIGGIAAAAPLPGAIGENPLLLSGLALAGANRRDEAGPDEEDGILTAEEIASLDLSGVEWAVLSACETGVGEVRAGEGVLGLRRAFQVAGARTVIMSLWSVDDESARQWMSALFRARHGAPDDARPGHASRAPGNDPRDTAESVREASLRVLAERRARGESTHPFYWGAFVAAGDWR